VLTLDTGLKRVPTGALIKDYDPDIEVEQALQLGLQEVVSEDPRFLEQDAPPLNQEFPIGSRIIFLGEHAYGVAAQVSTTTETSLSIVIAVSVSLAPCLWSF
jgi:5'-3' exoribonuclease 1